MVTLRLKHTELLALAQCTVYTLTQKVVSVDGVGKCWVAAEWNTPEGLPVATLN